MKTEIANHLSHPRVEATGSLSSGICKGLPLDYRLSVVHSAPYMISVPVGLEIAVFPRGCPTVHPKIENQSD